MRISISYATRYSYSEPARAIVQLLRLAPGNHDGQQVVRWRVEPSADGTLRAGADHFGNCTHAFYCDGPVDELTLRVAGQVDVEDRAGVVAGAAEPLPPPLFLRETPLTVADGPLCAFAREVAEVGGTEPVPRLHALMLGVHEAMAFETGATAVTTDAATAFGQRRGVCQDFAHVFIAAARSLHVPARYVSGHLAREDGARPAAHAWAEAWVAGLGWVGFDPVNAVCPTDRYVRVAVALDYAGAAPVRGARQGGGVETLTVEVDARAGGASQRQSQSQSGGGAQRQSQSQG